MRIEFHKLNAESMFSLCCATRCRPRKTWPFFFFFLVIMPVRGKKKRCIPRINRLYDFVNAPSSCQSSCQYSSSINQQEYGLISSPGVEQFEMHEFLVVKQSFPLRLILSSSPHEPCTLWIWIYMLCYMQISKKTRILLSPAPFTSPCSRNQGCKLQEKSKTLDLNTVLKDSTIMASQVSSIHPTDGLWLRQVHDLALLKKSHTIEINWKISSCKHNGDP